MGPGASTDRLFQGDAGTSATTSISASGGGPINFTNTGAFQQGSSASGSAKTLILGGININLNTMTVGISDTYAGEYTTPVTKQGPAPGSSTATIPTPA